MVNREYDVVIIGGGAAGLTAGLYTARARLKSLLIERAGTGGWIVNAEMVENYPGFPKGISGLELADLMTEQAKKYGLEIFMAEVSGLEIKGERKVVKTTEGDFTAKAVIIAGGSDRIKLGVPGEKEFTGRGVAYCALCDAADLCADATQLSASHTAVVLDGDPGGRRRGYVCVVPVAL